MAAKNKESSMAASLILPVAGATVLLAGATVAVLATRRYRHRKFIINCLRESYDRTGALGLGPIGMEDVINMSNFSLFFKKDLFCFNKKTVVPYYTKTKEGVFQKVEDENY